MMKLEHFIDLKCEISGALSVDWTEIIIKSPICASQLLSDKPWIFIIEPTLNMHPIV